MARTNAVNFSGALQFPMASAATDVFHKEDVQTLAQAVDQHDHTAGKGKSVAPTNASVTNAMLGPDVARLNLLSNPGFEVWQRGPGPFTGFVYGADRWTAGGSVGDTISVSRDTTNVDTGSAACAAVTFTKGTGTTGLTQIVEPAGLAGRTLCLAMRVRTATANAVRIGIYNGSAWTYSAYHTGGGTYQTLTISATIAGSFVQMGAWFDLSCTAYIDNAMLVVGSQAADYAPLHPADDLARCLRYYEVLGSPIAGGNDLALVGYATAGAQNWLISLPMKVNKPVAPTITKNGTWGVSNCGQPVVFGVGLTIFSVYLPSSAAGVLSAIANVAGSSISIESNP